MRTTPIVTVAAVVFALLIVAKSKTANLTEATQNPLQNTVSIYDLGVGLKNLPVQEVPLP